MQARVQIIIAILVAAVLAWILISPSLDELPGTTSRVAALLLVAGLALGIRFSDPVGPMLATLEFNTSHRPEVLAVTCTRLC